MDREMEEMEVLTLATVQQSRPQLSYHSPQSMVSIVAFPDYHSDPITDRSTEDYAGDSSSLLSHEAPKDLTPPLRLQIPARSREAIQSEATIPRITIRQVTYAGSHPELMQSEEARVPSNEELALNLDGSPPTPSANDALYLRYAIDQLTRDRGMQQAAISTDSNSEDSYPVERVALVTAVEEPEYPDPFGPRRARRQAAADAAQTGRPSTALQELDDPPRDSTPVPLEVFIPVGPLIESQRYPDLTFKPAILRLPFMIFMILYCILMLAAIMFCAIYSATHHGLTTFTGDIYGGLYFVFRFLFQIIGGIMILCVQSIMTEATRTLPFTMMASTSHEQRSNGLFQPLFSQNFMLPRFDFFTSGYPLLGGCYLLFWIVTILNVPLLSSLFSVVEHDGGIRWATVQGTAWTLVTLHVFLLFALSYIGLFFHGRVTGLVWDPRCIADIIALLPRSNSLTKYTGTEISSRLELRTLIGYQCDRLGYWKTDNRTQGVLYAIGEAGTAAQSGLTSHNFGAMPYHERQRVGNFQNFLDHPLPKHRERKYREERAAALYNSSVRYRCLPWFLSDTCILLWPVVGFILLLALVIVSFLTSTNIRNGFAPNVPATTDGAGFSPAAFLYSFVPSLIGVIMFLLFQALDIALRLLQPWKELATADGSPATRSLLLDYSSCYPFQCTIRAFRRSHYRVAALSLFSTLFLLIPILAGGVFFPLTALPSFTLLVFPNLPAFYLLLALLILYLIGLFIPIPDRDLMRLPHQVENLAEVISFLYNSPMLDDAAFRAPRSKADLVTRLTSGDTEKRFAFGWFNGRNGRETLGVDRIGKKGKSDILINREVLVSRRGRGPPFGRIRIVSAEEVSP